ncbi:hypothetical protein F4678DRAFT_433793 [Xylaria arbuscula]|nr:hypothetical protein F4678DRAFT_433793 [Xylaria arbuscula]
MPPYATSRYILPQTHCLRLWLPKGAFIGYLISLLTKCTYNPTDQPSYFWISGSTITFVSIDAIFVRIK